MSVTPPYAIHSFQGAEQFRGIVKSNLALLYPDGFMINSLLVSNVRGSFVEEIPSLPTCYNSCK